MQAVKKLIRRLFFYSSRQLLRRKRSYATIFITSVVLLSLVMTFLEMAESYYLRDIEASRSGIHHASVLSMREDYTDDFASHKRIETVFTVPYTSLMASSDDASKPARMTVETPEIDEYLHVRYLWGSPPGDGEIAVSADLYRAYGYLTAGEENELFFTAAKMTYFPLRISGIFECGDKNVSYAFVSEATQKQIDAETGAKTKYDHYIRFKNISNRYIAMVMKDLFEWFDLYDTDEQARRPAPTGLTESGTALEVYEPYINQEYLDYLLTQQAAPVIVYSMPVIIIAALMMASFMSNWMTANASEYGILGAIGANRRQLCAISAGQILLIGLIASVPVILVSSLLSNIYISTYNAASGSDVDFVYTVPWLKLIEAALWWNVLSCFFSYIGIARLTSEAPYVLISGSFRSRMPFVKQSDYKLPHKKDRIRRLAFIRSLRQIKSGILTAVITSLVCIVCGLFLMLLVAAGGNASAILSGLDNYSADMLISVQNSSLYDRTAWITEENIRTLEQTDGIAMVGRFRSLWAGSYSYDSRDGEQDFITHKVSIVREGLTDHEKRIGTKDGEQSSCVVDAHTLDLHIKAVVEGNPDDLFTKERQLVVVTSPNPPENAPVYHAGDKVTLSGKQTFTVNKGKTTNFVYHNQTECTIAAVIYKHDVNWKDLEALNSGSFLMTSETAALIGAAEEGEYDRALVYFDEGLTEEEMAAVSEQIAETPAFMRFDLLNISMQTDTEKQKNTAITVMLCFFFAMLYLSLVTMIFVDASLKVTKMRNEIAVLRQVGAEDRAIYKTLREESYLVSAIALTLSVLLIVISAVVYVSVQTSYLYMYADFYGPSVYPPELVAQQKHQIQMQGVMLLTFLLPVIPMHIPSAAVSAFGTAIPLRHVLKETITEGLRKDTD